MARERAPKRRGRLFCAVERVVLGMGMSVVAFVIERRLIKAIRKGSVEPAARTAGEWSETQINQGQLSTAADHVGDQSQG